jgi:hypothetical protein
MVLQCTAGGTSFVAYLDFYVFIFHDGHHNQQQSVPGLRYAHDKPCAVHEVLSLQFGRAGGVATGAVAPGLQTAAGWGAMQKLHTLEGAVLAWVSRRWDTCGGAALLR